MTRAQREQRKTLQRVDGGAVLFIFGLFVALGAALCAFSVSCTYWGCIG